MHKYFFDASSLITTRGTDVTKQLVYFKYLLNTLYTNGDFFWSWSYGLGGDIFGQFNYYISFSFFYLLTLFFDFESMYEVANLNLLISIGRLFSAMVLLFLLLRYHKRSFVSSLVGGLFYGGTTTFAMYSLSLDYMVDSFVLLPLLILTFDYLMERKKILPFVIVLAFILASNFYFAFITTVYLALYAIYKYFDLKNHQEAIKGFFPYISKFIGLYILSMGLASFSFLPAVYQFFHSDRLVKEYDIPLLFETEFYGKSLDILFLSYKNSYTVGLAIFSLFLLIGGFTIGLKRLTPKKIFVLGITSLMLIPFMYSVLNGFSQLQNRWYYLIAFTCSYISAYFFDEIIKGAKRSLFLILNFLVALLFYFYMAWRWTIVSEEVQVYDKLLYISGIVSLVVFILYSYNKKLRTVGGVLLICSLVISGSIQHYNFFQNALGQPEIQKKANIDFYNRIGYDNQEALEIISTLKKYDTDFGRTMWFSTDENAHQYNQSMYYQYKGHSAYQSLIPKNVHRFIKEDYNILQKNLMSLYDRYDGRLYIETVLNNQFYIIRKDSQHTPYGYSVIFETANFRVLENDHKLPIGFLYTDWISEQEFIKLNTAEKDQTLLKAVVLSDVPSGDNSKVETFSRDDLNVKVLYEGLNHLELHDFEKNRDSFVATTDDKSFIRIPIPRPQTEGEIFVELELKEKNNQQFNISMLDKKMTYFSISNTWAYPQERITINAGWNYDAAFIDVYLSKGEYEIKNIRVLHNSYEDYKTDVLKLKQNGLEDIQYTENTLSGVINSNKDGIFFLSIPYSKGWHATLNGEKIDLYEVNHTFIGFPIKPGHYDLELTYFSPFFKIGVLITILSFILLFLLLLLKKRRI
ncbi:putative membrane protein YfhO [Ureibacillus chungkukjangi]|uniref:Putative membrane protein YfhO n=2 Tax=Ureibacillus chungkukjangi TaxID=1202712 RepID=A0A318U6K6_9BACL|nr:putative membrane protein YfhO [Ureibacillus chungkukjangi]